MSDEGQAPGRVAANVACARYLATPLPPSSDWISSTAAQPFRFKVRLFVLIIVESSCPKASDAQNAFPQVRGAPKNRPPVVHLSGSAAPTRRRSTSTSILVTKKQKTTGNCKTTPTRRRRRCGSLGGGWSTRGSPSKTAHPRASGAAKKKLWCPVAVVRLSSVMEVQGHGALIQDDVVSSRSLDVCRSGSVLVVQRSPIWLNIVSNRGRFLHKDDQYVKDR